MQLFLKALESDEFLKIFDKPIDNNFLSSLNLSEPDNVLDAIDESYKSLGFGKTHKLKMSSFIERFPGFFVWECNFSNIGFEVYFPPLTYHQIIVPKNSTGKVRAFVAGKEIIRTPIKNEITLIPANTPAYFSGYGAFQTINLLFSPEFVRKSLFEAGKKGDPRLELGVCAANVDVVTGHMASAIKDYAYTSQWKALSCLGKALCVHLLERYGVISQSNSHTLLNEHQIKVVRELMLKSIGDKPDIANISETLRLTTANFLRSFRETTGKTPLIFFKELRMEEARALVEKTKMNLTEIAVELGFSDGAHFSNTFRKHWGGSPSSFRR